MSDQRLPDLLIAMRAAIARGNLTDCLSIQGQLEEQWDAIQERLRKLDWECAAISAALEDLRRGAW